MREGGLDNLAETVAGDGIEYVLISRATSAQEETSPYSLGTARRMAVLTKLMLLFVSKA